MNRKTDIILAGVGGQGILSIAAVIGLAAVSEGMSLKQAEVHGMSQRGGAVQSHLRLSTTEIASDLIPSGHAELIISLEPMEALRYLPYLSENGRIVSNSAPFINIPAYPEPELLYTEIRRAGSHILFDADQLAKETGAPKSSNMVILGAAARFLNLPAESLRNGIRTLFARKGDEVVEGNIKAFNAGVKVPEVKT
jgi:indolepyruvate ferredoxin oxidoreductase beta subunit